MILQRRWQQGMLQTWAEGFAADGYPSWSWRKDINTSFPSTVIFSQESKSFDVLFFFVNASHVTTSDGQRKKPVCVIQMITVAWGK